MTRSDRDPFLTPIDTIWGTASWRRGRSSWRLYTPGMDGDLHIAEVYDDGRWRTYSGRDGNGASTSYGEALTPAEALPCVIAALRAAGNLPPEQEEQPPPTPTYTPMRVRLVGHRDLGTVRARWLSGGRLELDDGRGYGPGAVFSWERVMRETPARKLVWWVDMFGKAWATPTSGDARPAVYAAPATSPGALAYAARGSTRRPPAPCGTQAEAIALVARWAKEDGFDLEPWTEPVEETPAESTDAVKAERARCIAIVQANKPTLAVTDLIHAAVNREIRYMLDRIIREIESGASSDDIPF